MAALRREALLPRSLGGRQMVILVVDVRRAAHI
jgi:hypothetical protein